MRIEILQYLKDNDAGHLISLNDKLKELLGNQPVHNLSSLLRDMHTDGVAIINGNYGWFGGAQAGIPHTLDNITIVGRILPKGKTELKDNELRDAQHLLIKSQLPNMEEINFMNTVLAQLNTKDVSHCHYLEELSITTNIDQNTIEVICQKLDKLKDCSYHSHCITITGQGKYKAEHGGYKDEKTTQPIVLPKEPPPSVTHNYNAPIRNLNTGNAARDINQSLFDEKSGKSKKFTKKEFRLNKKILIWTIIGVIVAILIGLKTVFHVI